MFLARNLSAGPGPESDFWFNPIGRTVGGVSVSPDTAVRLSTVYKCVRVRAETIGMLPLMIYKRRDDGGKEAAPDHPLYALLHDQPNAWQTSMQWRAMMQAHVDLRGNGYSEIVSRGGTPAALIPLHPGCVRVEIGPSGSPRYKVKGRDGSMERTLLPGEILHLAGGISADRYTGMNPIEAQREAIGAGIAARDYGASYFRNGAKSPMWIKMPGKFKDADTRRKWVQDSARPTAAQTPAERRCSKAAWNCSRSRCRTSTRSSSSRGSTATRTSRACSACRHKLGILDRATWGTSSTSSSTS